jgi:FkbM family methyltransferase
MLRRVAFQDRLYDTLAARPAGRRGALWLRNVATQVLAHRLAPSIHPDHNGETLLLRELASHLRVVIDVGANRGNWTAILIDIVPEIEKVLCYEPGVEALSALHGRYGADKRVEVVDAAVSDRAGEEEFFEEPDAGETSSLIAAHSQIHSGARTVRVVTIDDELDRIGIDHVDLLKIDAEGMDLHVLRGAERALRDHRVAVVQFEYNRPWAAVGSTLAAAFQLLRRHGYEVLALLPDGLHQHEPSDVGELFVYSNFVALLPESFPSGERARPKTF